MDALSDEELIARYRLAPGSDRSRPFVEELFRRHQTRVVAWCYRLTGDRAEAVDLAQDVFIKAYSSLDTFRADSKFTTWLYIIARNRWRDSLRARRSRTREAPEAAMFDEEPFAGNDALAAIEASDARTVVRRLMDEALDETEKRVMTLHYGHDMRLDAITAALGLTNTSGAKAYIVSARRKLNIAVKRWKSKIR
jgi:RNA polymerase sigma-70 factor (ECF subfamily)